MPEQKDVMDCLMRLMRSIRRHPTGEHHRSHGYIRLLRILSENDGQSSRELAEIMDIRPSSLTELINKLEMDGAILRTRDENDLRVIRVSLLGKGREILEEFRNFRKQEAENLAAWLTEEEKLVFCEICDKLSGELEKRSKEDPHVEDDHRDYGGRNRRDGHDFKRGRD